MIQIVSTFVLLAFKMFLDKPRALTIRFIRSSKALNNGGDEYWLGKGIKKFLVEKQCYKH